MDASPKIWRPLELKLSTRGNGLTGLIRSNGWMPEEGCYGGVAWEPSTRHQSVLVSSTLSGLFLLKQLITTL